MHEVAKDFGASTKEITEILTEYCTTPKNHMQVLGDEELSVIFEYMTQHHQVADLEQVLNNQASSRCGCQDRKDREACKGSGGIGCAEGRECAQGSQAGK